MASNYEELIKALRCKRDDCEGCDLAFYDHDEGWMCQYAAKDYDAAAAIEALNRLVDLNTERCECLREQLRKAQEQYEKHLNELEQQLPKRGKWIDGDARRVTARCSVCGHLRLGNGAEWANKHVHFCEVCGSRMGDKKA